MARTTRLMAACSLLVLVLGCDALSRPRSPSGQSSPGVGRSGTADSQDVDGSVQADSSDGRPAGASRTRASADGVAVPISFDDLNLGMQQDMVFRPFLFENKPETQELDGQRVSLFGYMLSPGRPTEISEFVLLKNNQCKYGPGGQADHLVIVRLKPGVTTEFTDKMIWVTGTLRINPQQGDDGNTWSLYDLDGESVSHRKP